MVDLTAVARTLSELSVGMTTPFDHVFGTDWASNEEILALVALCTRSTPTTRELGGASGLSRRVRSVPSGSS